MDICLVIFLYQGVALSAIAKERPTPTRQVYHKFEIVSSGKSYRQTPVLVLRKKCTTAL